MPNPTSAPAALAVHGGAPAVTLDLPGWPIFDRTDRDAVVAALDSGAWGSTAGTAVRDFETAFADRHRVGYAGAVSNGTLAIAAALTAAGVGLGDEVIVPPYTFIATASAPLQIGAIPVFADIGGDDHLLDAAAVEAAITPRTRAVIPVHLAGAVADMDAIGEVAKRHDLVVIEDCAQALGAEWRGRPVGGIGTAGTFSFQSSKNLTAGEGGAVTTDDRRLADEVYSVINVGRVRDGGWYEHHRVGWNLRMTEFQGALLIAQLARVDDQQRRREAGATMLRDRLTGVDGVVCDAEDERISAHGRHLFLMRFPAFGRDARVRDAAVAALHAEGVAGASGGYVPLHRNEALVTQTAAVADRLGVPSPVADCPTADQVSADTIWLPQHLLLAGEDVITQIATAIAKVTARADAL